MQEFIVNIDNAGSRLDKFLAKNGFGFALAQKLLRQKQVKLNGGKIKLIDKERRLKLADKIEILGNWQTNQEKPIASLVNPRQINDLKRNIIYQDKNLIAINKPCGIAVQAGKKGDFSIDLALPFLKLDNQETPRLVHRLDRDTSGILLLARNRETAALLNDGFKNKTIKKTYLALVEGTLKQSTQIISLPLIEKIFGNTKRVFKSEIGKEAITELKVLQSFGDYSLLELKPITGRMHQLRVHCREISHPIVGDRKYGNQARSKDERIPKNRLCLHSFKIEIDHFFGKKLLINTPQPDFLKLFNA